MELGFQMKKLLLTSVLFLSGCAGDSDIERVGKFVIGTLNESGEKITRERAAAVPFASMGLSLGSNPEILLVLGTTAGSELDWFAGESIFLRTRQGHVIRTAGLPYNMGGLRSITSNVAMAGGTEGAVQLIDFPDLGVYGAPMQCAGRSTNDETVEILGASIPTRHTVEHCEVSSMRWRFDNDFWQDPQRRCRVPRSPDRW